MQEMLFVKKSTLCPVQVIVAGMDLHLIQQNSFSVVPRAAAGRKQLRCGSEDDGFSRLIGLKPEISEAHHRRRRLSALLLTHHSLSPSQYSSHPSPPLIHPRERNMTAAKERSVPQKSPLYFNPHEE